jgi:Flp pilus assembly protein TadD
MISKLQRVSIILIFGMIAISAVSCGRNLQVVKKEAEANRNLGEALLNEAKYTQALKLFLKAQELNPNDPYLQNDLGLTYLAKKKPELAITHFKKALELEPTYSSAMNNLGTAYLEIRDCDAAIATFNSLLEDLVYSSPHYPLSNLGDAYFCKNDYMQAEKYYLESLEARTGFFFALKGLGKTYTVLGRLDEAIARLSEAAQKAPLFPEIYFDLAVAYEKAGDFEKARQNYQKVIELAPDSAIAREAATASDNLVL